MKSGPTTAFCDGKALHLLCLCHVSRSQRNDRLGQACLFDAGLVVGHRN